MKVNPEDGFPVIGWEFVNAFAHGFVVLLRLHIRHKVPVGVDLIVLIIFIQRGERHWAALFSPPVHTLVLGNAAKPSRKPGVAGERLGLEKNGHKDFLGDVLCGLGVGQLVSDIGVQKVKIALIKLCCSFVVARRNLVQQRCDFFVGKVLHCGNHTGMDTLIAKLHLFRQAARQQHSDFFHKFFTFHAAVDLSVLLERSA